MALFRMEVEYCGARYRGWQAQKNAEGVANALEAACRRVFKAVRGLQAAGRTDSGVHALGQVVGLDADGPPGGGLSPLNRLNDLLPRDIAVKSLAPAPPGFHARHSCVQRVYLYQVLRRRSAFGADLCWWVKDRLDVQALARAAGALAGAHDFASFCEADPARREATRIRLEPVELAEDGPLLLLRFRARSFLWKMVRRLTGALVEVGRGALPAPALLRALEKPTRELAAFTAPPQGLFLEKALYPGESLDGPPRPVLHLGKN